LFLANNYYIINKNRQSIYRQYRNGGTGSSDGLDIGEKGGGVMQETQVKKEWETPRADVLSVNVNTEGGAKQGSDASSGS
jgi:hypothetical protein